MSPLATLRIQLGPDLSFDDAADLVGYLADLGVSHLYCSPYLQAAPGSTHGYDVVDPGALSAELGGGPGYARLVGALREAGLGQVLDIVPNHMAVSAANRWWWDVLENGPSSRYARFFDIDWDGDDEKSASKILVPILGDHAGRVLEAGELTIERHGGTFRVRYHELELPLGPRTVEEILSPAARRAGSAELAAIAEGLAALPPGRMTDRAAVRERHEGASRLAAELERLCEADPAVAAAVDAETGALGGDPDRLDDLLRRQNYRLAHWRTGSEELDYRRFFNIETLIGVRVEDPEVFDETHALVLELVRDGTLDGLRIDHVDGLADPERYLRDLHDASDGAWTVVEKILEPGESLPATWPVAGTSGYDFLTRVDGLFVASEHEAAMTRCYEAVTGERVDYADVVHAAKHQIMSSELAAEVERATAALAGLCDSRRRHRDHTRRDLREALREVIAGYDVYRTYVTAERAAGADEREHVATALRHARSRRPDLDAELLDLIGELAVGDGATDAEVEFAVRLQQLTAPVMAKGVEDTAFYRYHRLISLNEVGGDPSVFGRPVARFHAETVEVAERWPDTMTTLSTHDTKRSADVRARLHVLSEVPEAWEAAVTRWCDRNERHRRGPWPDRNTEYLLYQTVVGAWPIGRERLGRFMEKATREAKVHTSWVDPVADHDEALQAFVAAVLADEAFVADLEGFLAEQRIVERGRRNSLVQMALLLTCPGVPDVYQGTELWDLSLVDPDNRRPVDVGRRRDLLASVRRSTWSPPAVADDDLGVTKLALVHRLLGHRWARRDQLAAAPYEPLEATPDLLAFTRGDLAVVARVRTADGGPDRPVTLPSGSWIDVVTGDRHGGGAQRPSAVLGGSPVAVLAREAG